MEYECDGGNHFLVFYKQYVVDNERLELNQNQVMLSDRQTQTVSLLTRVPSASGERYQGDGLDYWSQGDAAMVRKDEQPLYRNCVIP
nr:MliC family protein [Aestuariicella hydrocarbonica]